MDPKKIDLREAPPPLPLMSQEDYEKFQNDQFLPGEKDMFGFRSGAAPTLPLEYTDDDDDDDDMDQSQGASAYQAPESPEEEKRLLDIQERQTRFTDLERKLALKRIQLEEGRKKLKKGEITQKDFEKQEKEFSKQSEDFERQVASLKLTEDQMDEAGLFLLQDHGGKRKSKKSRYNKKSKTNKRRRSRSRRSRSGGGKEESGSTVSVATDPPGGPPGVPLDDIPGKPIPTMSQLEIDEINKGELANRDFPQRFETEIAEMDEPERRQLEDQIDLLAAPPVARYITLLDENENDFLIENLAWFARLEEASRVRFMAGLTRGNEYRAYFLELMRPENRRDFLDRWYQMDGGAHYRKGHTKRNNKPTKSRSRSQKRSRRRSRTNKRSGK
jgi:hypothetical protein